jgi:hypothetical protein
MTILVRSFRPSDADAVAEICHQTGFMGESADKHFRDRKLFALIFAYPNLTYSPDTCLVAELDSEVVGYCLVTANTKSYDNWFNETYKATIIKRALFWTLWHSPMDIIGYVRISQRKIA